MNPTFTTLYRQLGRVTIGVLLTTLASYGAALLCAVLGFSRGATSLGGVSASLAVAFVALFSVFLVASVVVAAVRWLDRRNQLAASTNDPV